MQTIFVNDNFQVQLPKNLSYLKDIRLFIKTVFATKNK